MLQDIRQTHRQNTLEAHISHHLVNVFKRPELMPTETIEDEYVVACVDYGKWIVKCPFCRGAEPVDFSDLRFFCLSCFNAEVGGKYLGVLAPNEDFRTELDKTLSELPPLPFNAQLMWEPNAL